MRKQKSRAKNPKNSGDNFDLARLICPVDSATFLGEFWEKRPLIVSGRAPDYYSDLFSLKTIDYLISAFGPFKAADFRVVKKNQFANPQEYLDLDGTLNLNRLYKAYSQGQTIILDHCKQHVPVSILFRNLERVFNYPVGATLFLTPRNAQAFEAHFDAVDTFILQIEGAKHWKIYDCALPFPLEGAKAVSQEEHPRLLHQVHLKAGDLLYIPSGFVHEALTSEESSLHLSVYFNRFTLVDLVTSALKSLSTEHFSLRKALPPGFLYDGESLEIVREQFNSVLDMLSEQANIDAAINDLAQRLLIDKPPPPDGHFSKLDAAADMETSTVVRKRQGTICRVVKGGDSVSIYFSGAIVTGPVKIESALRFIVGGSEFSVVALPGPLTDKEKLVLARRLVREGLLTIV